MWEYIRKKLGIKNCENELIRLNSLINSYIQELNEITVKLSELTNLIQNNNITDFYTLKTRISSIQESLLSIDNKIKGIPKEIVVKNVLSI